MRNFACLAYSALNKLHSTDCIIQISLKPIEKSGVGLVVVSPMDSPVTDILLHRNVILKMSIIGILCYYWLNIVATSATEVRFHLPCLCTHLCFKDWETDLTIFIILSIHRVVCDWIKDSKVDQRLCKNNNLQGEICSSTKGPIQPLERAGLTGLTTFCWIPESVEKPGWYDKCIQLAWAS